ncbi:MAG: hypothetical protein AAGE65_12425 [Planctomycetota bacterium]
MSTTEQDTVASIVVDAEVGDASARQRLGFRQAAGTDAWRIFSAELVRVHSTR